MSWETVTGVIEGPRPVAQYGDMNTELAKRLEAHKAACSDLNRDPLVKAALTDAAIAAQVIADWNTNRALSPDREELVYDKVAAGRAGMLIRRQAD